MEGRSPDKRDIPWMLVVFAALGIYAVILLLLNDEKVEVDFVFFSTRISKVVLILLCLALGFVAGFLLDRWRDHRKRRAA